MQYALIVIDYKKNIMKPKIQNFLSSLLLLIILYSFFHVYFEDILPNNKSLKVIMAIIAFLILISFAITAKTKILKNVFFIGAIVYALLNILIWIL